MGEQVEMLEHHADLLADFMNLFLEEVKFLPLISMVPELGVSSKFKQRRKVDLPEPDGPMIATTSPFWMLVVISLNTRLFPNFFDKACTSITKLQSPFDHAPNDCKSHNQAPVDQANKQ